jgi:hypothetical protein
MEEIGKKRLAAAGVAAAGLVYFLVCAFPLQKELILVPTWTRNFAQAPVAPGGPGQKGEAGTKSPAGATSKPIPFRLGDRYGYFTAEGSLLFAASASYGVAMAEDAFAPYERLSEGFVIKSPQGADLARSAAVGYPFFLAGRRFVVAPDQSTVMELGRNGAPSWTYRFSSIVTAFDASPSLAVFGLMDGSIVGLDGSGSSLLDFAPGGSRISGIYGVAVAPDGQLVAAIAGLDRQRLVVMERRSAAYRVAYHRYLDSDYRRPVNIAFTADGRELVYEDPLGVAVYDRTSRKETTISVPATGRLGLTTRDGEMLVLLSGEGERKRLICAALPDRRIIDAPIMARLAFVETRGEALFLGVDDDIVRMDLQER